jgi:hypothetical protein
LWQIHIFGEGNTRTTAVFLIKYLRKLGFDHTNNDLFAKHSWYFRNALVRTNYENISIGVHKTNEYLVSFLSNVLLGENNELKNRYLHIYFVEPENATANENTPNKLGINDADMLGVNNKKFSVNGKKFSVKFNVKFNENQEKMLSLMEKTPAITANEMAKLIGISERAVNKNLAKFKELNILIRIGSDKTGSWEISIKYEKPIFDNLSKVKYEK